MHFDIGIVGRLKKGIPVKHYFCSLFFFSILKNFHSLI